MLTGSSWIFIAVLFWRGPYFRLVAGDYRRDFCSMLSLPIFSWTFLRSRLVDQSHRDLSLLGPQRVFGQSLQEVASGIVFILFGQTLYAVGGAAFLTDFSLTLMGRFRGGPAKMAIVSSSLFGTISGSAVANVVVDGTMTIPMMKKSGYPPAVAAAVEATASTGGQIMPPVMGAAAFLIAEYLQIPYTEVALRALVPAVLFYLALFIQVDLLAGRQGLPGCSKRRTATPRQCNAAVGRFLVPLTVLVTFLFVIPPKSRSSGFTGDGCLAGCWSTHPGY